MPSNITITTEGQAIFFSVFLFSVSTASGLRSGGKTALLCVRCPPLVFLNDVTRGGTNTPPLDIDMMQVNKKESFTIVPPVLLIIDTGT